MRLYPQVIVEGQSFEGQPDLAVPNQSLTIKQILQRFIKRQPVPVCVHEASYSEDHGDLDLEKALQDDFTVQDERVAEQREKVKRMKRNLPKPEPEQKDPKQEEASPPKA